MVIVDLFTRETILRHLNKGTQDNAKARPELGIPKSSHSAHHKKHIAKVMVHCCVGYLFEGDVEAGGDEFLILCDRCASFKMPLRYSY